MTAWLIFGTGLAVLTWFLILLLWVGVGDDDETDPWR